MRNGISGLELFPLSCVGAKVKVDMADEKALINLEEHKRLASIVKSIHADLRKKFRESKIFIN